MLSSVPITDDDQERSKGICKTFRAVTQISVRLKRPLDLMRHCVGSHPGPYRQQPVSFLWQGLWGAGVVAVVPLPWDIGGLSTLTIPHTVLRLHLRRKSRTSEITLFDYNKNGTISQQKISESIDACSSTQAEAGRRSHSQTSTYCVLYKSREGSIMSEIKKNLSMSNTSYTRCL